MIAFAVRQATESLGRSCHVLLVVIAVVVIIIVVVIVVIVVRFALAGVNDSIPFVVVVSNTSPTTKSSTHIMNPINPILVKAALCVLKLCKRPQERIRGPL